VLSSVFFLGEGADRVAVRIVLDGMSRPVLGRRSARPHNSDDDVGAKVSRILQVNPSSMHQTFHDYFNM
jgi:hypothetical protein